jgi:ABC-type sugar transport system substrate-binding protein
MLKKSKGSITAFGLSGDYHSESTLRNEGLLKTAAQYSIDVKQLVYTNWKKVISKEKLLKLIKRYGMADIVWCASDVNAIGALEGTSQLKLQPNKDFVIGGFDWTPSALKQIQQHQLTASVGGHLFQGARALIKIFDYHHGIDNFNRDKDYKGYLLEIIDINNINTYQQLTNKNEWKDVDFSLFSYSKQKQALTFNTLNILSQLEKESRIN